jgi:signal transduction histidine kinase
LIGRHVDEHDPARIARIDAQIAEVRADFTRAAAKYNAYPEFLGEHALRTALKIDVAASDRIEDVALAYSRRNEDAAANAAMDAAEPVFDVVARDLANLTQLNREAAAAAQQRIDEMQNEVALVRIGIAIAIIVITGALGIMVTRSIWRTDQKLREQALALEASNRELDAFAGRVAHDLRGPLNTIKLASSIPGNPKPSDEIMQRAVTQMTDLVNDLLQLSRTGAPPKGSVAQIQPIAAAIETELAPLVQKEGGALRVDVEPAAVCCTQGLLREVLWNLGENAVKYHRPETPPSVELVGRATRGRYRLRVIDNGRGMTAEESSRVFEPFFRGSSIHGVPGTGLGLAIVRRVVDASGGTISVESQLDHGTTFTVELPLAA